MISQGLQIAKPVRISLAEMEGIALRKLGDILPAIAP